MFDNKQKNTSLFTYNLSGEDSATILAKLEEKVEEFMKWYSTFNNKVPIKKIDIYTSDIVCETGCMLSIDTKINIVDILFKKDTIVELINNIAEKYNVEIDEDPDLG